MGPTSRDWIALGITTMNRGWQWDFAWNWLSQVCDKSFFWIVSLCLRKTCLIQKKSLSPRLPLSPTAHGLWPQETRALPLSCLDSFLNVCEVRLPHMGWVFHADWNWSILQTVQCDSNNRYIYIQKSLRQWASKSDTFLKAISQSCLLRISFVT